MSDDANALIARALAAWKPHAKSWEFLGYRPLFAQAVLAEYLRLFPKDRNIKPLHVMQKLGRSRVSAIIEAVKEQTAPAPEAEPAVEAEELSAENSPPPDAS